MSSSLSADVVAKLPHHTVSAPAVTCGSCWTLYGIPGSVFTVIANDGSVLYHKCNCGAVVDPAGAHQLDLLGEGTAV